MLLDPPEDAAHLTALLAEAGATLLAQAVKGTRPAGVKAAWPEVVRETMEAYGYDEADIPPAQPNSRAVTRMEVILRWVTLIPLDAGRPGSGEMWSTSGGAVLRKVVLLRALTNPRNGRPKLSWRQIAARLGCSHTAAQAWHAQGLGRILAGLHGSHRLAAATWTRPRIASSNPAAERRHPAASPSADTVPAAARRILAAEGGRAAA